MKCLFSKFNFKACTPNHQLTLSNFLKKSLDFIKFGYNLCIDLNIRTWLTIILLVFMIHGMGKTLSTMQDYTNS